jgi:hypothetical protein
MNDTINPDQLLLSSGIYSDLMKSADALDAEKLLLADPWNLQLRARLLLFYSWRGEPIVPDEIFAQRLTHICWFIQNIPDSKFCGERFCYLLDIQPGYEGLKELWLGKIAESENLMRRINAYLLFDSQGDANLESYFRKFFSGYENNLWVRALGQLGNDEQTWLDESICVEAAKSVADTETIRKLTSLAEDKVWDQIAVHQSGSAGVSDFQQSTNLLSEQPDLNSLALIAGYSWSRYSLFSTLGFDPEVLQVRLMLASWILRHVPGSRLVRSPIFMGPFIDDSEARTPLSAIEFLSNLWALQIQASPHDTPIAKNAKYFRSNLSYMYSASAKKISTALRKARAKDKMT